LFNCYRAKSTRITLRPSGSVHRILHAASVIGSTCCFLCACTSFQDKPVSPAANAERLETHSLDDPVLQAFLHRNLPSRFQDGKQKTWDLDALAMAAFFYSPDLALARARLAGAQAAEETADALPNPTVNLSPTYDSTTPPPWILGISFDMPIETAGKRGYRQDQARHLTEAAIADLTSSAWTVRSRVRTALLDLYIATLRAPLLRDQEAAQNESVRIFEQELKIGEISPYELTQSRIALNQTRFALRDNDAALAAARARLAATIGITPGILEHVIFDYSALNVFPPTISEQLARREALLERADIRAGLAAYDASQSALQLEIAKQYPDIRLGPGYLRDQGPSNIPGQYDDKWTLGISFTLPIFNQNQGPIAEAEARRAQAAVRFDVLQNQILADVETALTGYQSAVEKANAADALRGDLTHQTAVVQDMLRLGEISPIELAQRKLELTNASLSQLDALAGAQTALGRLEDTLQSPQAVAAVTNEAAGADESPANPPSLRQVQAIPLSGVNGGFDMMTADPSGQRFFLDAENNNTTEVINLAKGRRETEIEGMHQPKWVFYRPELNRLYIANGDGNVRVLDATTYKFLHTIQFREKANNLRFDPATGELFVGVGDSFGAIGIIDTKTDTVIGEIPLAGSPNQFELAGNLIYVNVPSANHVAVIDRRQKKVVATWPLTAAKGNYPMGIDRGHQRLFVGFQSGTLGIVDLTTGKEIRTLDIAGDPDGVHYDERRGLIYVSCGAGWLYVIKQSDPDHYSVLTRIATAEGAGTSLLDIAQERLFVPIPAATNHPAELRIYALGTP
jgi:cobalt-zinc-cadmium efflux system outer membrane protein